MDAIEQSMGAIEQYIRNGYVMAFLCSWHDIGGFKTYVARHSKNISVGVPFKGFEIHVACHAFFMYYHHTSS